MNKKLDRALLVGFIFAAFWYHDSRLTADLPNLVTPLVIMTVCIVWFVFRGEN